jgi:ribosomal protein S27AE
MCELITVTYACSCPKGTRHYLCKKNATGNASFCPVSVKPADREERWNCGKCALDKLLGVFDKKHQKK